MSPSIPDSTKSEQGLIESLASAAASTTTAKEVAAVLVEEIRGKNVLITGTSLNGIGYETALAIAKYANLVIITGYNTERPVITFWHDINIDVAWQAQANKGRHQEGVRTAAESVNARAQPLHVLIHNAAAPIGPFKLTVDGLERQFGTDHVGPFLLTKLLAPKLVASRTASFTPRVVFVSSAVHARKELAKPANAPATDFGVSNHINSAEPCSQPTMHDTAEARYYLYPASCSAPVAPINLSGLVR